MDTITFVSELKETLLSIESTGGNPWLHVIPNHALLGELKRFVFETATQKGIRFSGKDDRQGYDWRYSSFVGDVLDRERFERRVRYCIIKLREFGIPEADYFEYISKALDITLEQLEKKPRDRTLQSQTSRASIQDLLVEELAKCFETWYYPSDVSYYEFVTEHQLATYDTTNRKWRLSSIGQYVLQLSVFELIVFLCALEVTFARKSTSSRYLSQQTLETLSKSQPIDDMRFSRRERLPMSLRWYGIIDTTAEEPLITDFGRRILAKTSANLDVLRDVIMLLTESEVSGFQFLGGTDVIEQVKERTRTSRSLIQDQRASIETAVNLFMTGHYLDSLRLFYSNIEAVLNLALMKMGLRPEDFAGMKPKLEKLEKEKVLSSKLSSWLEVVTSRNKVLHGNIVEDDAGLVKPLFFFIGTFWNRLVEEIDFHFEKTAG